MSKTRRSTVNRAVAATIILAVLTTVGILWAAVFFAQTGAFGLSIVYVLALVGLLVRSYLATQDFRKQLTRHSRVHPHLAWHYEHLWFICKKPHLCERCKGWLAGVGTVLAGWIIAIFFYGFQPGAPAKFLGVDLAAVLGGLFLFVTPIHGMLGRTSRLKPNSFWESGYVLGACGFLSALSAPLFASVFFYLAKH